MSKISGSELKKFNQSPFLPHTGAMKLVEEVAELDLEAGTGTFAMTLESDRFYWAADGSFDTVWFVEIMAQAAAGFFHMQKSSGGKPVLGMLVGVDSLSLMPDFSRTISQGVSDTRGEDPLRLRSGSQLDLGVEMIADLYPFGAYACTVSVGQDLLATANLKFLTQDSDGGDGSATDGFMGQVK